MQHQLIIHPDRFPEGPVLYSLTAGPLRYLKFSARGRLLISSSCDLSCYAFILPGASLHVNRGNGSQSEPYDKKMLISIDSQALMKGISLLVQHKQFPVLCQMLLFQESYLCQMLDTIQPRSVLAMRDGPRLLASDLRTLLQQIELEQNRAAPGFDWMTRNIAAQLAILIVRQQDIQRYFKGDLTDYRELKQKMPGLLDYLRQHCVNPLSLSAIAEQLGVNASHLSRSFHQTYQVTIRDYLISCRLDLACQLLRNDRLLISEIAIRCGYKTASRFSAMFLRKTGMRPIEYRRCSLTEGLHQPQLDRPGQLLYDHINIQEY